MRARVVLLAALLTCSLFSTGCTTIEAGGMYAAYYADKLIHPGNPLVLVHYFDAEGNITRREWKRLCEVTDCGAKHRPAPQRKVAPK